MEPINAGDVPLELVIDELFAPEGLERLLGYHGAACFVLVRSGLAPAFYDKLIQNVETIDATTRRHIAFIVFSGNKSSIVRRPEGSQYSYAHPLEGMSSSNDLQVWIDDHGRPRESIAFDARLAEKIRSPHRLQRLENLTRASDVATTYLARMFHIPERSLPCLLFVDGSNIHDSLVVGLSPHDPMGSLYRDVLAPLSDEFQALEGYWRQRGRIHQIQRNHDEAQARLLSYPSTRAALYERRESLTVKRDAVLARNAPRRDEILQERARLEVEMSRYNGSTPQERLALLSPGSPQYALAHEVSERLTRAIQDKKEAYSEPLTDAKRRTLGSLSATVNQLRTQLSSLIGNLQGESKKRLVEIDSELQVLNQTEFDWELRSVRSQIENLDRQKQDDEQIVEDFATFNAEEEKGLELEAYEALRRLQYSEETLKEGRPRPFEMIRTMQLNGHIGFEKKLAAPESREKVRILFLAANPNETSRLDLEEELRAIEQELRATVYRDDIQFVAKHAVRADDLVRLARAERPTIVHFSGHGAPEGIVLRDETLGYRLASGKNLARLFKDRGIRMVVLNACFSMEQANSLSYAVKTVIGTTKEVGDEAARRFSVAFYRTLGDGYTIQDAFRDGGDSIGLHNLEDVYQLRGDASQSFFEAKGSK